MDTRTHTIVLNDLIQSTKLGVLRHHALNPVVEDIAAKNKRTHGSKDIAQQDNQQCEWEGLEQESSTNGK